MIRGKVLVDLNDALLLVSFSLSLSWLSIGVDSDLAHMTLCSATDRLENELLSELENARLARLLCKLGFINERPEWVAAFLSLVYQAHCSYFYYRFARDPRWSETGDRYIIKLFRDFVFHQVDENGNPVVNLGHVLTCLNKVSPRFFCSLG